MKELKNILADNVKRLRKEQGLSQEDLAFRAGIHRTYISSIECANRNVSIDTVSKLSEVLDVPAYVLLIDGGKQNE